MIKQNTEEWLKWRSNGIGASDAPIILGLSKFKTPLQLWEEKTGLVEPVDCENFAMQRGSAMEKTARDFYKQDSGIFDSEPVCATHPFEPFLRASLDGWSESKQIIAELKCLGDSDNHKNAAEGLIPPEYMAQVQYQLYVKKAIQAHYYSFNGISGNLVNVYNDVKFQNEIIEEVRHFWHLVQKKIAPPFSDRDYKPIESRTTLCLIEKYRQAHQREIEAAIEAKAIRAQIVERLDHTRHKAPGIKIFQTTRYKINYKKIPELEGVDLDEYRSAPNVSYTFRTEK